MSDKKEATKMSLRQQLLAIVSVARTTFQVAPSAVVIQVIGSILTAVLPIVTTYFAALTTTALAAAYSGDASAGTRAVEFVIITALLGVLMTGWQSLESYFSQLTRYKVEAAMTDRMYEHFLKLDFWRYDDKDTADMYDKARRFSQFFPFVFERIGRVVTQLVTTLAGVIALLFVSWWLAVIAIIAITPGIFIQLKLSRLQTQHWQKNISARRTVSRIEWSIMEPRFMAELRLYGIVRYLLNMRIRLRDKDDKARIEFERQFIAKRFGADILEAIAEITALVWVTVQIINRTQPVGQFIYVQQVVSRAIGGANGFVSQLASIDEDLANLYDYERFMKLEEHIGKHNTIITSPQKIELKSVSFHYPKSNNTVLSNISFSINKGQHVAIVGENGAGKSTLIKLLTGLYVPSKGEIVIDNTNLQDIDSESWHKTLSVLEQNFISYNFATVKENVFYGDTSKPFDQSLYELALVNSEAKSFVQKLPKKDENYVDQWMEDDDGNKGQDLSGGQWQRLALARNFYRNSEIIILDEPTSAIDALAESRIFSRLFKSNKTILTVSHRFTTIKNADQIVMLEDGSIVEQGTPQQLIEKRGKFYHMFESQI